MKFIDEVTITIQSGDGGAGCVSFRREKFIPRGGPDGGDGGKGGDVILRAASQKRTLYDFHFKRHFRAPNGRPGEGRKKSGKNGQDLVIDLPPGTVVVDAESGTTLKDLVHAGDEWLAARGGRGGQGNEHFKSATRRAPRFAQPGEAGELKTLRLELKLIADVGLVGLPNAGKSTLIRAISAAKPKTGAYPFTTLSPNLGVVKKGNAEPFVVADIPGLIAGAHEGAGLGTRFLRHTERTRILVHLVSIADVAVEAPLDAYRTVNDELGHYSLELSRKPQIVALNKMDLPGSAEKAAAFEKALPDIPVVHLCALTGAGTQQLINRILQQLDRLHG